MKLLACTDGSAEATRALELAAHLAKRPDASLTVLTVRKVRVGEGGSRFAAKPDDPSREGGFVAPLSKAIETLQRSGLISSPSSPQEEAGRASSEEFIRSGPGRVRVRFCTREGDIVEEILAEIKEGGYDLVLTGSRGLRGVRKIILGSTAQRLAILSPVSVLVVKSWSPGMPIMVCTDGSRSARRAYPLLEKIGPSLGSRGVVVGVEADGASPEEHRICAECAQRAVGFMTNWGFHVTQEILKGQKPADKIIEAAGNRYLVVMGASLRGDLSLYLIGSIPLRVMEYGECCVLLSKEPPMEPRPDGHCAD